VELSEYHGGSQRGNLGSRRAGKVQAGLSLGVSCVDTSCPKLSIRYRKMLGSKFRGRRVIGIGSSTWQLR
jgi:hypothetical protein